MLLNQLLLSKAESSVAYAAFVAAYVVFQVKAYVEGCGMGTHVTLLKHGDGHYLNEATIEKLEEIFKTYRAAESNSVHFMGGYKLGMLAQDLPQNIGRMRTEIEHLIRFGLEPIKGEAVVPD